MSPESPNEPPSDFQQIFEDAIKAYKGRTKKGLLDDPLTSEFEGSSSSEAILSILKRRIEDLDQNPRLIRRLEPIVKSLLTLSTLSGSGGHPPYTPAQLVFSGIYILLSTFKGNQDNLVAIFERIGMFLRRLDEIYTKAQQTEEMTNKIFQIMAEIITILGIATKEIEQGRIKKYGKKLIGRSDMEDAMERFDKLTHEEAWISIVKVMRAVHAIDETVAMASIDNEH